MLIVLIAVSAAIVLYSSLVILFSNNPKERIHRRLTALAEREDLEQVHNAVMHEKKKLLKDKKKKTRLVSQRFEDALAMAGIHISAQEFMTLWCALSLGPLVIGILFRMQILTVIALCVIGFAIPPLLVQSARNKQQLLVNKQLGESLTIMSNCMRSGYSFQQAMQSIAKDMQPPISAEFGRVIREIHYGATLEQALNNMAVRVKNKDFDLLISAVITSTNVGGNLSEILDTISETITDRIRLREEVRILTSQGRFSGMIIGLLPVAIIAILMLINPGYLTDFVSDLLGQIMLGIAAFLEVIGFVVINRMVDIKY